MSPVDQSLETCCGIVVALYRAEARGSDNLLGYAPDFTVEEAFLAIQELIRATPARKRQPARAQVLVSLAELVPDWRPMVRRAVGGIARRR